MNNNINNNNNVNNNENKKIIMFYNNDTFNHEVMRLKVGAMTGAPIASAITSTVIGAFVIAWMTKK